jgi:hypothetical protein
MSFQIAPRSRAISEYEKAAARRDECKNINAQMATPICPNDEPNTEVNVVVGTALLQILCTR